MLNQKWPHGLALAKTAAAWALAALGLAATATAQAGIVRPTPGSGAYDGAQQILGARWYQWTNNWAYAQSPLSDSTGALAYLGNQGDVFFVSDPFIGETQNLTFSVPAGMPVFFNIGLVPFFQWYYSEDEALLRSYMPDMNAIYTSLDFTLDGVSIPEADLRAFHRLATPAQTLYSPLLTDLGFCDYVDPGICDPIYQGLAVTEGWWVLSEPLSIGVHTVSFGGRYDDGSFAGDYRVNATIFVPEPSSLLLAALGLAAAGATARRAQAPKGSVRPTAAMSSTALS